MNKIVYLILISLFFSACRKNTDQKNVQVVNDQEIIKNAKEWYETNVNSNTSNTLQTQALNTFSTVGLNAGNPGKAIWEQAKVEHYPNNITLTYLPYDSTGTPMHFTKYGFKRMLIYSYESGDKQAFWVEVNSDNPLPKGDFSLKGFTGKVLVFDLNNTFLTGTRYSNGQKQADIHLGIASEIKKILNTVNKQNKKLLEASNPTSTDSTIKVLGGGFICSDWYQRVCIPEIGYCSEWQFVETRCTEIPGSGNTGGGSTGGGSTGGGSTGGSSGGTGTGTGEHEPGSGGSVGVNTIGYYFPTNLYNGKDGNYPLDEYPTICSGAQAIWNSSTTIRKETVGVITSDGKFIYVAQVQYAGGSWGGLYTYQGQVYYTYPDSQGSPNQAYAGMVHSAGQYFIPIKGTIHTHSPCLDDGTDGITSITLSEADQQLAARYPNLNHYIIGCNAVGQFSVSNGSESPTLLGTGEITATCGLFH